MRAKSIKLAWIMVKDLKKAVQFYTETAGLKLVSMDEQWNWAELSGYEGGAHLGIGQISSDQPDIIQPGQNSVLTFTVENMEKACQEMSKKGAKLVGGVQEIPGHVKLQMVQDQDGNYFQIVEEIYAPHHAHHKEHSGCCGGH